MPIEDCETCPVKDKAILRWVEGARPLQCPDHVSKGQLQVQCPFEVSKGQLQVQCFALQASKPTRFKALDPCLTLSRGARPPHFQAQAPHSTDPPFVQVSTLYSKEVEAPPLTKEHRLAVQRKHLQVLYKDLMAF